MCRTPHTEALLKRLKEMPGHALMKHKATRGRTYFSLQWDLTPTRRKSHFDYHVEKYLPDHASQGGIFHRYA